MPLGFGFDGVSQRAASWSKPGPMQDGGDAFQGARAAAALEAVALVLALTFPDTAAVPDFRAQGSVGKVGTGA